MTCQLSPKSVPVVAVDVILLIVFSKEKHFWISSNVYIVKMLNTSGLILTIGIFIAQAYIFLTVESWEIRTALAIFTIYRFWQNSRKRVNAEESGEEQSGKFKIINISKKQWKTLSWMPRNSFTLFFFYGTTNPFIASFLLEQAVAVWRMQQNWTKSSKTKSKCWVNYDVTRRSQFGYSSPQIKFCGWA